MPKVGVWQPDKCSDLQNHLMAVVIVSNTLTTAETMLNAQTIREWISSAIVSSLLRVLVLELYCSGCFIVLTIILNCGS